MNTLMLFHLLSLNFIQQAIAHTYIVIILILNYLLVLKKNIVKMAWNSLENGLQKCCQTKTIPLNNYWKPILNALLLKLRRVGMWIGAVLCGSLLKTVAK